MAYRQEISWDQNYNDVFLLDLKTGKPKKVLEHWGSNATAMSPGGKYVLYFDERNGHWFSYRVSDGARVNLTEKIASKFQQENNTPDLPGPYGSGGWTADDKSVLLYDKFDIWEVKPDGTGARMVTNGEGTQAGISSSAIARSIPTSASSRRTSRCCCPRPTTSHARERLLPPRQPDRDRRAREGRDARQGVRRAGEGEECRHRGLHAVAVRGVPRPLGQRYQLQGHEEGVERQPAAGRVL